MRIIEKTPTIIDELKKMVMEANANHIKIAAIELNPDEWKEICEEMGITKSGEPYDWMSGWKGIPFVMKGEEK